jgi:hypothetical protein
MVDVRARHDAWIRLPRDCHALIILYDFQSLIALRRAGTVGPGAEPGADGTV